MLLQVTDFNAHSLVSHTILADFIHTNIEEIEKLLSKMNKITCNYIRFVLQQLCNNHSIVFMPMYISLIKL